MKINYFAFAVASACLLSCTHDPQKEWIHVEFINPTEDPIVATLFDDGGYSVKDTVQPFSSVIDSVQVGAFSVGMKYKNGDFDYFPRETPEKAADTLHYEFTADKDGKKSLRYKIQNRFFQDQYAGRYAFDLSLDSTNRYAVADIRFMYGQKDKKAYYKEFMKVTNQGKNFVSAVYRGSKPMVFPKFATRTFDEIPESITTYYNYKGFVPYIYPIPQDVASKDVLTYLVKEYVLLEEE